MRIVFLASFPAGPWQANCYLAATKRGPVDGLPADCVVVDPGMAALDDLSAAVADYALRPVAVVASHGHLDHVASAKEVCDTYGVPLYVHPDDRVLLSDPAAGLSPMGRSVLEAYYPGRVWEEPAVVLDLVDGQVILLAGLELRVVHAPGHRPGCVLLTCEDESGPVAFTGDVVFAGSIGRTDLPGGHMPTMARTLRDVVSSLPDSTTLLPGHGPATTMAQERVSNPYLRPDFWEQYL